MRRYAITNRTLFPDETRVPHLRDSFIVAKVGMGQGPTAPAQTQPVNIPWVPHVPPLGHGFPSAANRVPHPAQSYREGWDPQHSTQLSALVRQTAQWAAEGIDYIQLREKDLSAATLAALGRRILEILRDTPTKLLINSRPDIAVAVAADGVHLTAAPGQLSPAQVRELYAAATLPQPIVSISCHSLAEVEQARHKADLILFAPIFQKSIAGELISPGQGLEALRAACLAAAPTPVYALGGVTPENALACLKAGAAGVAGIRLFHH